MKAKDKKELKKAKKEISKAVKAGMKEESCSCGCNGWSKKSCGGCAYFLGFIGAAIYYISIATGFWNGVWGVVKALVWPAFLIFELLKFIGA